VAPLDIKPGGRAVRVLAFGDFGDGGRAQRAVAAAMVRYDKDHPFDFGLALGDNFYEHGLNRPDHPRWRTNWDELYDPLGIQIYAVLGNHDYEDLRSPQAEIARSASPQNRSWCLPRSYYTFTAGPVQFFALDTTPLDKRYLDGKGPTKASEQREWLEKALAGSRAQWKIVYGHHPVFSTGSEHGRETAPVAKALLPVLSGPSTHADVYLAGHDHDMEYLKPANGVQFFVSGAGGHKLRPMGPDPQKRSLWAVGNTGGFTVLEADENALTVRFLDTRETELCAVELVKGRPAQVIKGCKEQG
jgi:predicted phosphodiesterase